MRANSTIKNKVGVCPECNDGVEKVLISGLCAQYHYKLHRQRVNNEKRKRRELPSGGTKNTSRVDDDDLNLWFKERRIEMTGICCNCNHASSKFSDKFYKFSIAHIFPKSIFFSVRTHHFNWIELCIKCHTEFDRNLDTARKMRCWPIAVSRFRMFESLITETHKYLSIFKSYITTWKRQ